MSRESLERGADRPINVSSVFQSNSYGKDLPDPDHERLCNTLVVGVKEKTKGC